ncbi:1-acyl-sn-glycerol-3-phosphate acyltransferase [Aurantiacibacter poecillastricola]|uniref:1-acyl-sn-glycerol-3-phosphate acyltransferase n=1 Tax=Aurantiacibacter poecillastricola TaxID=3064385 RepID=UPI00273F97A5|nr:1-acyl-sn-glycerol-3-phosphate acyltransferase [Aurantiacibacter sp. 219JJ12-13]MDP5260794.1 1-acyl-sn-glycerol-3-phosphate acyltransferase [Aurantiacibacter sp. 219JJ12-13]
MPRTDSRKTSLLSRITWTVLVRLFRYKGWRFEGRVPDIPKFIFLGAPHTSNWDFVVFAGVVNEQAVEPSFIGKNSLFKWPMTRFMYDMGGIPVDRSRKGGYVQTVAKAIEEADRMSLVIAPEGSRSSDGRWRSGFYHIALAAGIPIVPAWVNNETMRGGIGEPIWPSGDFHADLAKLAAFYKQHRPDCERFDVLAEQAEGEVETPGSRPLPEPPKG